VLRQSVGGQDTWYLAGLGQQQGADWSFFTTDGLGSIRQSLSPVQGSVLVNTAISYDPFGQPYRIFGKSTTTLGFTGHQTDGNGLQDLGSRYYNPSSGTFLSRSTSEANGYSYAQANPANYSAPGGQTVGFGSTLEQATQGIAAQNNFYANQVAAR